MLIQMNIFSQCVVFKLKQIIVIIYYLSTVETRISVLLEMERLDV